MLHGPNQGVLWAAPQDGLDGSSPSLAPQCCTGEGTSHPPIAGRSTFIQTGTVTNHLPAYRLSDWFCTGNSRAGSTASPRHSSAAQALAGESLLVCTISFQQESQHTNPAFAVRQWLLPLDISILLAVAKLMGMNSFERRAKERIRSTGQPGRCRGRQKRHGAKGRCHEEPYSPRHSQGQECQKLPGHFPLDNSMKTETLQGFSFPPFGKRHDFQWDRVH